ncbi:DUF6117 family protein [Sphingomonas cannabina]
MSIPHHARANFQTLLRAATSGDLALMECTEVATGEARYVICAVGRDDGEICVHPVRPSGRRQSVRALSSARGLDLKPDGFEQVRDDRAGPSRKRRVAGRHDEAVEAMRRVIGVQHGDDPIQLGRRLQASGLGEGQRLLQIVADISAAAIVAPALSYKERLKHQLGGDGDRVTDLSRIASSRLMLPACTRPRPPVCR